MLAGSSTLLSPRHRLRSEASSQFQACHLQLPSMNTQRLDFPCNFARKDASRGQPMIRPVGLSVDVPVESKGGCSIRPKLRVSPSLASAQTALWEGRREAEEGLWEKEKKRNLKRYAEQDSSDESCKRKRCSSNSTRPVESSDGERMSLGQMGNEGFWFPHTSQAPRMPAMGEPRACFVPSNMVIPSIPIPSNRWMDSMVITNRGDDDVETSQEPNKASSGSSTSSESHELPIGQEENSDHEERGNGSQIPGPVEGPRMTQGDEEVQGEHQGFELVSLLLACVDSISSKNIAAITSFLSRLGELASPEGTPIHRVTAYFTEGLALRVAKQWPHIFHVSVPREIDRADEEMGTSLRLFNNISPIPKFLHFTSNELLLRAFEGKDRVHIIDFDIKQGLQWPGLFQSLASRGVPPSHVRITGIGDSKKELQETGDRLAGFAESLNLPFEFHAVVDRLEDVRLWMLHVKERESVAVNCILQLHKMLYDDRGGALRDFLGLIRSTNPTVVLMAEQEAKHNVPSLESRVSNSLKYYSAIFDSIDSNLPLNSSVRIKVEEMFAREIRNIVACEGNERTERHETFEEWRKLMELNGFRPMGIGEREMFQSKMILKMYSSEDKYSLAKQGEDEAGLTLSWLEQPLYTVSAWAPVDAGGSSSSLSLPS